MTATTNNNNNDKHNATTTYRADYSEPNFWIDTVAMRFDLHPTHTRITTVSTLRQREGASNNLEWLGDTSKGGVVLNSIAINGTVLNNDEFNLSSNLDHSLSILNIPNMPDMPDIPNLLTIEIITTVNPSNNTSLMGLYASQGNLFTQCEAQGFRRMTYAPDRPDVMSRYTVSLYADKTQYPVLLSNGNLLEAGDLENGQHYAVWQDPHLKPSYLFAVVAGDLAVNETLIDNPHVASGQSLLQIYTRPADQAATQWALDSLKASIAWDLQTFGRPLDLERYMVVAVGDFNMGAMENKGLNIFNTAYVLAQPETATDTDYGNIEAVIGHEYFHNWTGNRITCRDWFQLTLKEGLTVYRDQTFSADMAAGFGQTAFITMNASAAASAQAVRRIEDVATLRAAQFGEDAGPMAHSIRPDSFEDISNFYTATVYEKGAEVIRMQALLANKANNIDTNGFRKGMDTYFARHDGQAVTCDDFINAISDGSGADLEQFKRWYEQAGTPTVQASGVYEAAAQRYTLTLQQNNPPVGTERAHAVNQANIKLPLHIPVLMGLLSTTGVALSSQLNTTTTTATNTNTNITTTEHLLHLTEASQIFIFEGVVSAPVPSLLRGFSAPVKLQFDYSDAELAVLMTHDTDAFNRWEAAQRFYERLIIAEYNNSNNNNNNTNNININVENTTRLSEQSLQSLYILHTALNAALNADDLAPAFKATLLTAPSYNALLDAAGTQVRPHDLYAARETVINRLAQALLAQLPVHYAALARTTAYSPDALQAGERALRNTLLMLWLRTGDAAAIIAAQAHYAQADNMTNRMAALSGLLHHEFINNTNNTNNINNVKNINAVNTPEMSDFYTRFADNDLVIDKWFALQATQAHGNLAAIEALIAHPAFKWETPNRMRSVVFRVCMANPTVFHTEAGYAFWQRSLQHLIKVNPEVAARLARAMDSWQRYEGSLADGMQAAIRQVLNFQNLPKGVAEVLNKAMQQ